MIRPIRCSEVFRAPNSVELLKEYAEECSISLIGRIDPQKDLYDALEGNGALHCFGVYKDEELIGFATVLVTPNPHYGKKLAVVESLFIAKRYRTSSGGRALMAALEEFAKDQGCVVIGYSAPTNSQMEKLLTLLQAYRRTNTIFMRVL